MDDLCPLSCNPSLGIAPSSSPRLLYVSFSPPRPVLHTYAHAQTHTLSVHNLHVLTHVLLSRAVLTHTLHTCTHTLLPLLTHGAWFIHSFWVQDQPLCSWMPGGRFCPYLGARGVVGEAPAAAGPAPYFPEGLEFKLSLKQGWGRGTGKPAGAAGR